MFYSPVLSAIYGSGAAGTIPTTSKLAGLSIVQLDSPTGVGVTFGSMFNDA